uniref:Pentacotripeptide-repeat region of PRORP domain-containing protein n=1 Tax=Salix viminalis TaxID=40686 RepID=A0A6N2KWZ9_SALVM
MHRLGSLLSHKPLLKPRTPLYSLISSSTFSYSPNSIEIFYDHLLKSCKGSSSLKQIHSALTTAGLITTSPHLSAQIIIKYAKCGDLNMARLLFNNINVCYDEPTSFLCNTMIRAYANVGQCFETIKLYSFMRKTGTFVNNYTYPFVFKACALNLLVREGKVVHGDALKNGFGSDLYVEAGLVDMYAKCGLFVDCRKLFDEMSTKDLVCWTAMITAYEQAEKPVEALILFKKMQQEEGLLADSIAVVSVASAVGQLGDVRNAQTVHGYAFRKSLIEELCVGNSILAMHTKCGNTEKALFMMMERDVISWNSMLSGYTQNGQATEALLLFDEMRDSDCQPTPVTALIMVSACAYLGSLHLGRKFHDYIVDSRMEIDTNLSNALVDMYAKCGDLEKAVDLFYGIPPLNGMLVLGMH